MITDKEYPATHSMSTAWYCVDEDGNVVEPEYDLDDDLIYLSRYDYEGEVNNEDVDNYTIQNTMSREDIYESILETLAESYR